MEVNECSLMSESQINLSNNSKFRLKRTVMISGILYNVADMHLEDWWCAESAKLITLSLWFHSLKLRSAPAPSWSQVIIITLITNLFDLKSNHIINLYSNTFLRILAVLSKHTCCTSSMLFISSSFNHYPNPPKTVPIVHQWLLEWPRPIGSSKFISSNVLSHGSSQFWTSTYCLS